FLGEGETGPQSSCRAAMGGGYRTFATFSTFFIEGAARGSRGAGKAGRTVTAAPALLSLSYHRTGDFFDFRSARFFVLGSSIDFSPAGSSVGLYPMKLTEGSTTGGNGP